MGLLDTLQSEGQRRGLRFVVIGGYAVMAHGFTRSTYDLDLLIRRSDKAAWRALLEDQGFGVCREGPTFLQFDSGSSPTLPLDLMLVGDETFEQMVASAVSVEVEGGLVAVVSLIHLVALKCHAIRYGGARRAVKDTEDLIRLIQTNRVNVADEPFRATILKHGTAELYDKLLRATAPE